MAHISPPSPSDVLPLWHPSRRTYLFHPTAPQCVAWARASSSSAGGWCKKTASNWLDMFRSAGFTIENVYYVGCKLFIG